MEVLNNIFTLQKALQFAGIVFSFFSFIFSIQLYANLHQVMEVVATKRNRGFQFISLLLIIISILLFIAAFVFL